MCSLLSFTVICSVFCSVTDLLGNKAIKFKSRTFYVLNATKNASFATKYRTERRDLGVS